MSFKRTVYQILKYSNDANAVSKGRVGRRASRRAYGKAAGKLTRKLFG